MPIYLFLVKHKFIFSVKKLMISLIEKAPYMLSPPFLIQCTSLQTFLFHA
ncbi:anthranilate synthase component I TrpE domain protein [Helicobacter pylori NQ4200]|uniref:Anthranilate synthase component I TrpE domain protein n=1 Tax=Helicobacter pylori NQ4200 TaxID=992024 RepID=J0IQ68_HELPX|nr:anthranilate synthase component I TrpE domain protein [Helicobacter pylori NQ4200]